MPTISADRVVGKGLIAKVTIAKLNGTFNRIGTFEKGEPIGNVYSYVMRDGKLYWMFYDTFDRPYYVQHGEGRFVITDAIKSEVKKQQAELKAEEAEELKKLKGELPYYLEKYGIWIIASIAGIVLLNTYIKKKA